MYLSELKNGEKALIAKVKGRGAFRKRIIEMGFVKGREIEVVRNAPLRDPIEYRIMNYYVSLRRSEASLIEVMPGAAAAENLPGLALSPRKPGHGKGGRGGTGMGPGYRRMAAGRKGGLPGGVSPDRVINVALVGNPNSGKTTLFNRISGARERVGNYGGVTVGIKEALFQMKGYVIRLFDLPGTYSMTAYTGEELCVREYIVKNAPDIVVNVLDSSNLERNLYLTTQLIDMDLKVVAALNMFDEIENRGDTFNHETLGLLLGIPMVPTSASRGEGLEALFERVIELYEDENDTYRHIHINYGHDIEASIHAIQEKINIPENRSISDMVSTRFLAVKLLEKDSHAEEQIFQEAGNSVDILLTAREEIARLESHLKEDCESLIVDVRYGFAAGAVRETFLPAVRVTRTITEKIDSVLTSPFFGFPFFIFFMWLIFQITFTLGEYPMIWIESFMAHLSEFISFKMSQGLLRELITDGAIAGAGGVLVFLPNILILFFLISLMEDTGYMARASFIMDRLMHRIGLHGKSFIPLLMGFGCNVPAIMATRTLENRNDRLLTMLIIPFMSCSARLPVYVLITGAFFSASAGTVLFGVYLTGVLVAVISALFLKRTLFRQDEIPFVMELPPYRIPGLKSTLIHMWDKGAEYLKKIAGVVLIASILIWALGRFPEDINYTKNYSSEIKTAEESIKTLSPDIPGQARLLEENEALVNRLKTEMEFERLAGSYIGIAGKAIEPVVSPLGFDWRMGISLLSGLAAKEIVVSTMAVLYHGGPEGRHDSARMADSIKSSVLPSGRTVGPLEALSFMIFVLTYFPCFAAVATIRRESGSWKWAAFSMIYTTTLAWLLAFAVYRAGLFMGF